MSDFPNTQIPENLRELVNAQLMDDETIQWIDQPIPFYFSAVSATLFFNGMCLILLSFLIFLVVLDTLLDGRFDFFALFAFMFCLLFNLLALSAPLLAWREAKRMVYALTNFRAIIVQGTFFGFNVTNYYPADFANMICKHKANGVGSLYFPVKKLGPIHLLKNKSGFMRVGFIHEGFIHVRNVREVERMLQELKRTKSPEQG